MTKFASALRSLKALSHTQLLAGLNPGTPERFVWAGENWKGIGLNRGNQVETDD